MAEHNTEPREKAIPRDNDIAVIGMACRLPGADDPESFWGNLRAGVESISRFSAEELRRARVPDELSKNPAYVPAAAILEEPGRFDASFFGFSAREAEITDPQHRIFLECAWEALESAGRVPERAEGTIGVFAGAGLSSYLRLLLAHPELIARMGSFRIRLGNDKDYLPTWTSYKLNLKGPSVGVQSACSTSLVAVHMACQSLLGGECDMALAGGVSVTILDKHGYLYQEGSILSPDGHCRPFDAAAQGTVGGCGAGVVLLKPLADAIEEGDPVLAVIRGSAVNNDGSLKVGFTAPSVDGQARVVAEALAVAEVEPESLGYVEAHGTATALGDPVEITALAEALGNGTDRPSPCAIGSVKSNLGHLDVAAGAAGLIKTVLSLRHGEIPPSLHYEHPNPKIDFVGSGLDVVDALRPWPSTGTPRRAGVSSFGIGGTNAHVVLEEAPRIELAPTDRTHHLLPLSARSAQALDRRAADLAAWLEARPELDAGELADVAYTLQAGRESFAHRRTLVATGSADAATTLVGKATRGFEVAQDKPPPVFFLFPGQGSQYAGMASGLYRSEPIFRAAVDRCADTLQPYLGLDPRRFLTPSARGDAERGRDLRKTSIAQPLLFTLSWALSEWWEDLGVHPAALIGHSIGEYVAACRSGVFSLEDALALVAERGRLMQTLPPGAMVTVALAEEDVRPLLGTDLSLAAVNAPTRAVVSGPQEAIDAFVRRLAERGIESRRLVTSRAFHSSMMKPILERFTDRLARVELNAPSPSLPFISNLTGTWIEPQQARDPAYWADHLRSTVRFSAGIGELLSSADDGPMAFLEVGPGQTLTTLLRQHPEQDVRHRVLSSLPRAKQELQDEAVALGTLGKLWCIGLPIDLARVCHGERRRRVPLPTYPFEHRRFWVDTPAEDTASNETASNETASKEKEIRMAEPAPRREAILEVLGSIVRELTGMEEDTVDPQVHFIEVGVDSLMLIQAAQLIEERLGVRISIIQLLEDLTTLGQVADHLDRELVDGELTEPLVEALADHAAASLPAPEAVARPFQAATPPVEGSLLEQVLFQQTQLLGQLVEMMRTGAGSEAVDRRPAVVPTAPTAPPTPKIAKPRSRIRVQSDVYVPYQPADKRRGELTPTQSRHLQELTERYNTKTRRSKEHVQRYRPFLADGRMSARFRRLFKELIYPIVGECSAGSRIWDLDGNEYVDFGMGFGLHLFGHSPAFLRQAMEERMAVGMELGPHSNLAGEVAERICELTGFDRATFCNSGTEAVMVTLRMARTFTRRKKIAIFAGAYHGWSDLTQARAIIRDGKRAYVPMAPGMSPGVIDDLIVLDFETPEALETIRRHAHELAAVLVEPVQSRRPEIQARDFLHELRRVTAELDIVLIFDEMVTGFRVHPAGAQGWFGVEADLAIYGKVLAGGLSLGVAAGKSELMDVIDGGMWRYGDASYPPAERTLFSGAYFKHPLTMAAARAILERIRSGGQALYDEINARTERLASESNAFLDECEVPLQIGHYGSLFRLQFPGTLTHANLIYYHLVDKGAFLIPEVGNCFLSTAHTDGEVDFFVAALQESVGQMIQAGFLPGRSPAGLRGRPIALPPAEPRAPRPISATAAEPPLPFVAGSTPVEPESDARIRFSLYYFGTYEAPFREDKYDLLLEGARFADRRGFHALWLPERHFHPFGGFSPNPSVVAAALARETKRLALRAGSVVLPLHHPVRVAEEWSVVDNLSRGRVGVSFASGWHPNDFAFAPGSFDDRHRLLVEGIEKVRRLWRGDPLDEMDGKGKPMQVRLFPMPRQKELPIWLTGASRRTFEVAGELGSGVVTNLQSQSCEALREKIDLYRQCREEHGHDPETGRVCVLMHTYIGADRERTLEEARQPFYGYMRSNLHLLGNFLTSHDRETDIGKIPPDELDYLLGRAYDKWIDQSALLGTPDSCAPVIARLIEAGVDEVGCMIDFGVPPTKALAGLEHLDDLRRRFLRGTETRAPSASVATSGRELGEAKRIPLTEAQKALWFLTQLGPGASRTYNEAMTFTFHGPLDRGALEGALDRLVQRHEALRTRFAADGESQLIAPSLSIPIHFEDLSNRRLAEARAEAEKRLREEAQTPLDLLEGPILRARLLKITDGEHQLALTSHHLVIDGHSSGVITGELAALYSAAVEGERGELPPAATLYEALDARPAAEKATAAGEAYWRELFADGLPRFQLPYDRPRPKVKSFDVTRCWRPLGETLSAQLKEFGRGQGTTTFMNMLAGFSAFLWRLTGREDLLVGINATDTLLPSKATRVSYRINAIALPLKVRANANFAEHVAAAKRAVALGYEHQGSFSPGRLMRRLGGHFDPTRPVIPALLDIEREGRPPSFAGLEVQVASNPVGAKLDLYLNVIERPDELVLRCDGDADLFEPATLERWMDELAAILEAGATEPEKPLSELPLTSSTVLQSEDSEAEERALEESNMTRYQQLLWIGEKLHDELPLYVLGGVVRIRRALDPSRFEQAARGLIASSDALRTVVEEHDGVPRQRVIEAPRVEVPMVDLRKLPAAKDQGWSICRELHRTPMRLDRRLFEIVFLRLAEDDHLVFMALHHLIADALTYNMAMQRLLENYEATAEGPLETAPEPLFTDFVERERALLQTPEADAARAHWKDRLAEEIEPLALYGRSGTVGTRVRREKIVLSAEESAAFIAAASQPPLVAVSVDLAIFNAFGAIISAYLHRVGGHRRVSLGTPYHNRPTPELRRTLGLLMQILPLRIDIAGSDTFVTLADRMSDEMLEAFQHRAFPVGNLAHRRAYEVELNYYSIPDLEIGGAILESDWLHPGHGGETLAFQVDHRTSSGTLTIYLDFHREIFDDDLRTRAIGHLRRLISDFVDDPGRPISRVALLSGAERAEILGIAAGPVTAADPRGFHQIFEEQVRANPLRIAASAGGGRLTYQELDGRANHLAHRLHELEIGGEAIVGLLAPRGLDFLTAVLGIFKAGAAYLPLEPDAPPRRLAQILAQSRCADLLVASELEDRLRRELAEVGAVETRLLRLQDLIGGGDRTEPPTIEVRSDQLSYVIFTSGSTGAPKGAMVHHRGMINHLWTKITDLDLGRDDVVAQTASQCFDISVWQYLAALAVGGRVHGVDDETARDPRRLLGEVRAQGITILEIVPSLLQALLDELEEADAPKPDLPSLRFLLVTGEALPPELCRRWLRFYPHIPMLNAYGPTECSDDITHHLIDQPPAKGEIRAPIGRPLLNLRVDVLAPDLEPVPLGVVGELHAAGRGVGRGYLNDPARTAAVFVPDPWGEELGGRLYKTGDLARYRKDHSLEFLGRVDHQVKIRGFRIELDEISVALSEHPEVRQAVVVDRADGPGGRYLAAYLVAAEGSSPPQAEELRPWLGSRLPDYMVPATFTTLQTLPTNANGKLDRKALPSPGEADRSARPTAFTAPRTASEKALAAIWAEVLGVEKVGIHDDFFDLGGDSILSIHIVSRATRHGFVLSPSDLFRHTTIAELSSQATDNSREAGARSATESEPPTVAGEAPLTPIQRWFFDLELSRPHHWNQVLLLEASEELETRRLRAALVHLLAHHDALRSRFTRDGHQAGAWRAEISEPGDGAPLIEIDLTSLAPERRTATVSALAAQVQASLSLVGPLLRAAHFRLGADEPERLLLAIHHLVVDGVSWRFLLEDLRTAYRLLADGERVELPAKTTSFQTWGRFLIEYAASAPLRQERTRWLELPWDRVRPLPAQAANGANLSASARRVMVDLDDETTRHLLRDVPKNHDIRIQEALLGALAESFHAWTRESVLLVDIERHGREELSSQADLSRTVGWFTVIQPVIIDLEGCDDSRKVLRQARESLRRFPNGGLGFGVLRAMAEDGGGDTELGRLPTAEVAFNYLGQVDQIVPSDVGWKVARESAGPVVAPLERRPRLLEITAFVSGGRFQTEWAYSADVHSERTIHRVATDFIETLRRYVAGEDRGPETPATGFDDFGWSAEEASMIADVIDETE